MTPHTLYLIEYWRGLLTIIGDGYAIWLYGMMSRNALKFNELWGMGNGI